MRYVFYLIFVVQTPWTTVGRYLDKIPRGVGTQKDPRLGTCLCIHIHTHTTHIHTYTLTCRIIFAHAMIGCLYYIWTISWFNRLKSEIRVKNITYKFQTDVKIFRHHYNNMFIIRCIPRYSRILCSCCNDIIKITNILYIYSQRVSL